MLQKNNKIRLCGEMINYIESKYSKQEQKEYKTRHSWGGKVIPFHHCYHHSEIEFWPYYQITYQKTRIHPKE